jgi:hypothetical protein
LADAPVPIAWIRSLAAPYLRGYRAVSERRGSLRGFWFLHPPGSAPPGDPSSKMPANTRAQGAVAGFFVGYLVREAGFEYLNPQLPECLAFAFVCPLGGPEHRRLVSEPGSLLRRIFEYIRWLTHRPPRFVFHDGELAVMTRHQSMREWPGEKYEHYSRNFFIEVLAWLVRSGLVRKLRDETPAKRAAPGKIAMARAASRERPRRGSRPRPKSRPRRR